LKDLHLQVFSLEQSPCSSAPGRTDSGLTVRRSPAASRKTPGLQADSRSSELKSFCRPAKGRVFACCGRYVDSVQSRGLLLVVPKHRRDRPRRAVGYCSRRGAGAPRLRLCRIGACCAVLVEPWICLSTRKWVIPGCAGGARSPASRSD